jgi:hypothetical protein
MKTIRTYSMQFEADLARIALEGADIPAVVLGVGVGIEVVLEVFNCSCQKIASKQRYKY